MSGTRSQRGPLLSGIVMVLLATVATGLLVVIGFQGLPETVVPSTYNDEQHETRHVDVTGGPSVRPTPHATTGRPSTTPPRSTRAPESVPGSVRRPGSGSRPVTRPTTPVPPPARTNPPAPAPTKTVAPPTRTPTHSPSPTPTCTKARGKCPKTGPTRQPSGYSASSDTGSGKAAAQPSRTATGRKSTG